MRRFLGRFFKRSTTPAHAPEPTASRGSDTLEVVGESHYQEALWQIVGGFRREPIRHAVSATLVPEPESAHDAHAVKVLIGNHLVGHLSREDAVAYRPGLARLAASSPTGSVVLAGQIVGGGPRRDGIGFLGVFLEHDPADFGVAPHYTTGGVLRTGLAQARATDFEDDDYDLSWLHTLDASDEIAIRQLRDLLRGERDPIDRHYMLSELEARLYRCRESMATALEEFDAVCLRHHGEMIELRPALLDKFGAIPIIEMYRQAAIRCQKARQWQAVRTWAERGLGVYGEDAARAEAVEDLRKRLAHATARMQAAAGPQKRDDRTATSATAYETLVCASCGASFERERTRGRKPKACPACRDLASP